MVKGVGWKKTGKLMDMPNVILFETWYYANNVWYFEYYLFMI